MTTGIMFRNFGFTFFLIGVLTYAHSQSISSWKSKVDDYVLDNVDDKPLEILVYMTDQLDLDGMVSPGWDKVKKGYFIFQNLRKLANSSQRSLIDLLERKGIPFQSMYLINIIKTEGDLSLIEEIASRKDVRYIIGNPPIDNNLPLSERNRQTLRADQWGIAMINADKVWDMGIRGEGIIIGGQDTGYEWDHPALKDKYRGYNADGTVDHNYNWHDAVHEINPLHGEVDPDPAVNPCGLDVSIPCDDHNHGTHTMGIMVGAADGKEIGVAPEAKWCGCRNMDRGYGTPFTYLECFQWFLAPTDLEGNNPDPSMAPHVINNSWSCPLMEGCSPATFRVMNTAVKNLKMAGIMVVVSAGNSGPDCATISSPAAIYDESFTIGAIASNDTIARFSSRGPVIVDGSARTKPNVVAPGVKVLSSIPNGEYREFSGTSMAGPHVAGVVALMLNANPQLEGQVDVIEDILERTAIPMSIDQDCGDISGNLFPNNSYGYGRIDALAAVEEAISMIVDLKDVEGSTVNIFPNPVSDFLNLGLEYLQGEVTLEIFDLNGRKVYSRNWYNNYRDKTRLQVTDLATGIYIYRILSDDYNWQGKIVKI